MFFKNFFHWHLYLCISSFLCNCIWVSEVMYLCVRVFADIPWSMRACIAMCGAAWCQRKPSAELGWKGSGYEERNGIIQKHHLHLPPSNMIVQNLFACPSIRALGELRLSEFAQISEFLKLYITDSCQTSDSFGKIVNF